MFRKKADVATVTVLDDDDNAAQREQLGLANSDAAVTADDDVDGMTADEMRQLAVATANSGRDATRRALGLATESRQVAAETAATMQQQTAQLEKLSEDIEEVHDYLDQSERTIEKLTKNKLVRLFQRKKPVGKGLDKVKGSKKDEQEREDLRSKGLESVDVQGMQSNAGAVAMRDLDDGSVSRGGEDGDKDGVGVSARRKLFGRKGKVETQTLETREVREDYSEYTEEVAQVLREQDDDLDKIGDALSDMKAMANAMNNELEYQDKLIDEVQDYSHETSRRTKANARKIAKIK